MSAAALQPSPELWAEMRRSKQLFFSVGYPYHSTYLAQPEHAGFMLWRNEWGQPMLNSACDTRVAIAELAKRGAL